MNYSMPQPAALSPDLAAAYLGLGRTTTYRLIKEGRLRSIKVGRRRLVPAEEITRFLADEIEAQENP